MAYVHGVSVPFSNTQAHTLTQLALNYPSTVYMVYLTKDCIFHFAGSKKE